MVNEFKGNLTVAVRSVVLEAWKERWPEEKWSMAIKKFLPYIEATDKLLLSSLLLEHAMISASPNVLLLDYLRYAINSKMTSFSSMVQNIITYKDVSQPYCLAALVVFLTKVYYYPFSQGIPKDPMELPKSLVLAKAWLLEVILKSLARLNEQKCPFEIVEELLSSCAHLSRLMTQHDVCNGLICLALSEPDPDPLPSAPPSSTSPPFPPSSQRTYFHKLEHLSGEINRLLCQPFSQQIGNELRQALIVGTKFDNQLIESNDQYINLTTNILIVMDTYLFPCNDMQVLAEKLVLLEQLQKIERPRLYSEVLRSCYLGLLDEDIKPEDIKWNTFIYIRVPILFSKLLQMSSAEDRQTELCLGLEHLLDMPFLLDAVDSKCNSDCLQFLVNEFVKHSLLTEMHVKRILTKRQSTTMRKAPQLPKEPAPLVLKAEATLITILKNLDAQNNPEMSLRVMNPLLCGKSFELVSSVAAATGKLQTFVVRLIRINEMSKMGVQGEPLKNSQIRATMFDISFLMLCNIVQVYDLEVVSSCTDCRSTFFYQWATRYLPDQGRFSSYESSLHVDTNKVDDLLEQLNSGPELKTSMTRWDEVCLVVPRAIYELLYHWKCNAIDQELVKTILDAVKGSMCCLAVVAATFLSNLISIGGSNDSLRKEISMLQQVSSWGGPEPGNNSNNYQERSHLVRQFMHYLSSGLEIQTPMASMPSPPSSAPESGLAQGPAQHLEEEASVLMMECGTRLPAIFHEIHSSGCLKVGRMITMEKMRQMAECSWFARALVEATLSYGVPEDLTKGVCVAHALFQMDLEELTACLIDRIIPKMLRIPEAAESNSKNLTEPHSSAVVRLTVMNLAVIARMKQASTKDLEFRLSRRKRKLGEFLLENENDSDKSLAKHRRSESEGQEGPSMSIGDNFMLGDVLCGQEHSSNSSTPSNNPSAGCQRDLLTKPLGNLLLLFQAILTDSNVGQQTDFALKFIGELLKAGTITSRYVLQSSPPNLAQLVAKFMHKELTIEQLFMFADISSTAGKCSISKAIFQAVRQGTVEAMFRSI